MNKIIKVILLTIIFGFIFIQVSLGADVATLKVEPDESVLEPEDEIELKLSISNVSVTDGITEVYGIIDFDTDIFELVVLDYDEAAADASTITKTIIEKFKEEGYDLLYISDTWCIATVEEEGEYAFAAFTIENKIDVSSTYTTLGTITLKTLDDAESGSTKISIIGTTITGEVKINEVTTPSITINSLGSADIDDIPSLDEDEDEDEDKDKNTEKENVANEDAPYTGVEDVIPFIIIAVIIGAIGYIKYKKYQGI